MKSFPFLLMTAILLAWPTGSRAEVVIYLYQDGVNVVASASGTINTASLGSPANGGGSVELFPVTANLKLGPTSSISYHQYNGISGPTSFGSAVFSTPSTYSGDIIGVFGTGSNLFVPTDYVSDTSLSATATFDSTTLSGLGLTVGMYTYTWGSGNTADSLVVNIGSAPPAPEPGSLTLMIAAAVTGLSRWLWTRRRAAWC